MRLVAGVLALTLFAPLARAEDAGASEPPPVKPSGDVTHNKVPLRVVRVMPESRQALLFDRTRATHVLAEVGGKVEGYTVESIDDDEVVLSRDGTQIVLAAPAPAPAPASDRRRDAGADASGVRVRSAAGVKQPDTTAGAPSPIDPYDIAGAHAGEASGGAAAHTAVGHGAGAIQPGDGGVRVVSAPSAPSASSAPSPAAAPRAIEPGADGVRVVQAPGSAPGPAATATTAVPEPGAGGIRVAQAPGSVRPPDTTATDAPAGARSDVPATTPAVRVVEAPGAAGPGTAGAPATTSRGPAGAPPVRAPGALGAPDAAVATAPPSTPSPGAAITPPIRVAEAPAATPAIPAATTPAAPAASIGIAASPGTAPAGPPAAQPTASLAAPPAGSARRLPSDGRTADARTPPVVAAARPVRAQDRQTADARALADIMTADTRTRSARGPAPSTAAPANDTRAAAGARPQDAIVLSRNEVDGALADFARLTAGVRGRFSASGVVIDAVGEGTIFQRAGLRAGDVITTVDGARLRSLDDAANVYARAPTAKAFAAQLVRDGRPVTLHVVIQ